MTSATVDMGAAMSHELLLVRHGRSAHTQPGWIDIHGVRRWMIDCEAVEISPEHAPPTRLARWSRTRRAAPGRAMEKLGVRFEGIHRQAIRKWDRFEEVAHHAMLLTEGA